MKKLVMALALVGGALVVLAIALPNVLKAAGLHPDFEESREFDHSGKRALIITTSHAVLAPPGENKGKPTGVFASEMTVPYYEFTDAGMTVDVASVAGGAIPIDPLSFRYMVRTPADERYLEDPDFQALVENSHRIDDLDFRAYDAIFLAGGWGAAYDLGFSDVLAQKITEAYYAERKPIIGSVCHGVLGLINARNRDGHLLVAGRRMTGVTDKQVTELGIDITPQHPETELRAAGALFESRSAFRDMLATHVVVDDERRFVTGQNQNSGHETAQRMMGILAER